jgi:hypothetical protein
MVRLYRRAGWRVTPIGAPRVYWGEERTPCHFDPFTGFPTLTDEGASPTPAAR